MYFIEYITMDFVEYIINNYNYNSFINIIEELKELNNITTDILNKYGGF
jgi:hypothetical protein